jgi:hypothetical protein
LALDGQRAEIEQLRAQVAKLESLVRERKE